MEMQTSVSPAALFLIVLPEQSKGFSVLEEMNLGCLSWVKVKDHLTVHLRLTVEGRKSPTSSPVVCGWQSRKELPLLSDCTTELECSSVRKSRHFQIYRGINCQCWECLTGHSSWRLLVQQCARTGLLCFDFLSWPPWQMCCREGGDQPLRLYPPVHPHLCWGCFVSHQGHGDGYSKGLVSSRGKWRVLWLQ